MRFLCSYWHIPLITECFLVQHALQATGQSFRVLCFHKLKAITVLELLYNRKIALV